jgi:hypothetical protein
VEGQDRARLLAGDDHQRRAVAIGGEQVAERVADPDRGMQVDQGGVAGRLGEAVGHPDRDRFLQRQDIVEVVREIAEHRQLGRAGIAEDPRHPELAQQREYGFADGGLVRRHHPLPAKPRSS